MEKKRKRASFSPTTKLEPRALAPKEVEEMNEKPVMQQVVEVVVEEPEEKSVEVESPAFIDEEETVRVKKHATVDDEEELKKRLKDELREELKRELKKEMEVELRKQIVEVQEVEEPEMEEASVTEVEAEPEEVEIESEPEVEPEQEPESKSVKHIKRIEDEEESEEQKETVAELFGKNSENIMPEITVHKGSGAKGLVIWAITMVAVAIGVGGGLVIFANRSNQSANTNTPTATITPQNTAPVAVVTSPTNTPKPTSRPFQKKEIKIQIQNGGGVVGAGSKMKALLEGKGYTVTEVGNASSYDHEETEIIVKESKADVRDALEEDISTQYSVGKIETTLPESSSFDVRVIVGKK